jgi:hypothetical protein
MPTKPKAPESAVFTLPSGRQVTLTLVLMTPDSAQFHLIGQVKNRKLRKRHVDTLVRDIQRGDWHVSPAGIVLDEQGRLIDGQHRLTAILATGQSVPLFVWHGWPPAAQDVLDMGAARSVAEQLGLDGVGDSAKLFSYVNNIALGFCRYNSKITLAQTRAILPLLPKLPTVAKADSPKCQIRSAAYLGIIALALHIPGMGPRVAKLFDMVTKGFGIDGETHPAHRIRTHFFTGVRSSSNARVETADYVADCVQAWCEERPVPTVKTTGTGMTWIRQRLPEVHAQMRTILGYKS